MAKWWKELDLLLLDHLFNDRDKLVVFTFARDSFFGWLLRVKSVKSLVVHQVIEYLFLLLLPLSLSHSGCHSSRIVDIFILRLFVLSYALKLCDLR